jgi:molybdopterin biosynthesis enzyme
MMAEPLPIQRSSVLMSMVAANGIVIIPEDVAMFEAGREVDVTVMGDIET